MIYSVKDAARWNDTDATRCVRPSQLLIYMQETACRHMNSGGQDLDALRDEKNLAFIVTRLTLELYRPLHALEEYTCSTWISEGKGLNFPRFFRIVNGQGEKVVEGASQWGLFALATHLPLRAGAFRYATTPEEPLPFATPRRFCVPEVMTQVGVRRVVYSDIDYNGHMNNTRYPDMVCDFLPEQALPHIRTMHFDFVREARYGAELRVLRGERKTETGTAYLIRTLNEADEICLEAEVLTQAASERIE